MPVFEGGTRVRDELARCRGMPPLNRRVGASASRASLLRRTPTYLAPTNNVAFVFNPWSLVPDKTGSRWILPGDGAWTQVDRHPRQPPRQRSTSALGSRQFYGDFAVKMHDKPLR